MLDQILLHIYYDDFFKEVELSKYNKNLLSFGKDEANDIVINSAVVENNHFILKNENAQWVIYNKSAHGVIHNGKAIDKKVIHLDDIFVLGGSSNTSSKVAVLVRSKNQYDNHMTKFDIKGKTSIKLGKHESNHICYTFQLVSGEHAEIFMSDDGEYHIRDLNSTNGIYLNGRRVYENLLNPGDVIHICGYKMMYDRGFISICNVGQGITVNGLTQAKGKKRTTARAPYPFFQRSPRLNPELPEGEVEIPNPPSAPSKPQISWISILMPPVFMIMLMLILTFTVFKGSTGSRYMIFAVGMSLSGVMISVINYTVQKSRFRKESRARKDQYLELIHQHRRELQYMREQQRNALLQVHPGLKDCIERVSGKDRRLWERTPLHDDFLVLRLGSGSEPFRVKIKTPRQELQLEQDPLRLEPEKLAGEFAQVHDIPICLSLYNSCTAGIIGIRREMIQTARALAVQIATHHSYDEVKIIAIFPSEETSEWEWMRWLPHTWDEPRQQRFLASDKPTAHKILSSLYDMVKERELQLSSHTGYTTNSAALPHLVFFLADMRLMENEAIMSYLAQNNKNLGISTLFLFDRIEFLPKDCQAIIESGTQIGRVLHKNVDSTSIQFNPDKTSSDDAEYFARHLAPLRLKMITSSAGLPKVVPMLSLFDVKTVEDLNISTRWKNSEAYRSLATPLGIRMGGEKLLLDLHERTHGPHGLVAGTTGSGKSELLQSFIISIAVNFHPHDVAFVLIDYKGGGMANAFIDLPHLVGTITNLGGNQTTRAMMSIKSELKARQALFGEYGVNHIDSYQRLYKKNQASKPLPHLIIIADEFAELKSEHPEFMDELVSTARVGRSLGVHLILATQKPAGVVDEQIWSNSRFRLCLKVQGAEDSMEVIKRADAANIKLPGRSYLQVGNNEIFELFQSGWSGAGYDPDADQGLDDEIDIYAVELDGDRRELFSSSSSKQKNKSEFSQLQVMVKYLHDVAESEGIQRLKGPWLPPLPEVLTLDTLCQKAGTGWDGEKWLPSNSWVCPVIGLLDNPSEQSQSPLAVDLGNEGHLGVYGGPGYGKTTLLQTLITSLALTYTPEEVNIYAIDFGSRTLNIFSELPHVGGIVMLEESEKFGKLSKFLLNEMDRRKRLFADQGVSSLPAYRRSVGELMPALVIVVDNFPVLYEVYSDNEDLFIQLSREGGNLGIHLVATSNSSSGIRYRVSANFKIALALQLSDRGDYLNIVGRTFGMEPSPVNGRGLIRYNPPLEFQTALSIDGGTEAERTTKLKALFKSMNAAWKGATAAPIPIMPEVVHLQGLLSKNDVIALLASKPTGIPVGLFDEDLSPVCIDLMETPSFIVTGSVQCGKTAFLRSWILGMASQYDPSKLGIYLIDSNAMGLFPLKALPHVKQYITNGDQLTEVVTEMKEALDVRKIELNEARSSSEDIFNEKELLSRYPSYLFVVDDFNDFMQMAPPEVKDFFELIVRRERRFGFHIVVSGMANDISSSWENMVKSLRELQTGLLLCSPGEQQVFNIRMSFNEASKALQTGEGYLISRGRYKRMKSAFVEDHILKSMIEKLQEKYK